MIRPKTAKADSGSIALWNLLRILPPRTNLFVCQIFDKLSLSYHFLYFHFCSTKPGISVQNCSIVLLLPLPSLSLRFQTYVPLAWHGLQMQILNVPLCKLNKQASQPQFSTEKELGKSNEFLTWWCISLQNLKRSYNVNNSFDVLQQLW